MNKKFRLPGPKILLPFLILVLILVAIRIALPHFLLNYVNDYLKDMHDYEGHVADIEIHLWL